MGNKPRQWTLVHKNDTGLLIALEGIDGCGKSTLAQRLNFSEIEDYHVYSRSAHGLISESHIQRMSAYDYRAAMAMYDAQRFREMHTINQFMADPKCVLVMDRWTASNVAYGLANGVNEDYILGNVKQFPIPHLTIYLRQTDIDRSQSHISSIYDDLADGAYSFLGKWVTMESKQDIRDMRYEALQKIKELIDERQKLSYNPFEILGKKAKT